MKKLILNAKDNLNEVIENMVKSGWVRSTRSECILSKEFRLNIEDENELVKYRYVFKDRVVRLERQIVYTDSYSTKPIKEWCRSTSYNLKDFGIMIDSNNKLFFPFLKFKHWVK